MKRKKLGLLHTTIRGDEKLILEAAKQRNIAVELVDIRDSIFSTESFAAGYDIALERCVSTIKGTYAVEFLESLGKTVVNSHAVSLICEDKFTTSCVLRKNKVKTPDFALVFSLGGAVKVVQELGGYPIVVKPPLGSWGRLLSKINDEESLETVIEHKEVLGNANHHAYYIQSYVHKPNRDIRAFVTGGEVIAAIYRSSTHWITNTARGGVAQNCEITQDLRKICGAASKAVGGGILAMDVFETADGLTINEINHTMEFKNSEAPTGVSISGRIVDYCLSLIK